MRRNYVSAYMCNIEIQTSKQFVLFQPISKVSNIDEFRRRDPHNGEIIFLLFCAILKLTHENISSYSDVSQ